MQNLERGIITKSSSMVDAKFKKPNRQVTFKKEEDEESNIESVENMNRQEFNFAEDEGFPRADEQSHMIASRRNFWKSEIDQ